MAMKKCSYGYYLASYRDKSTAEELKKKNPRVVKVVRNARCKAIKDNHFGQYPKGVYYSVFVRTKNSKIKF